MTPSEILDLQKEERSTAFKHLRATIEHYLDNVETAPVAPPLEPETIRAIIAGKDFDTPMNVKEAIDFVSENLWKYQVHTPHPRYFGLFNPRPATMGIVADSLVATFNPQLAAWSHNPFAAEVEQYLIQQFGKRFDFPENSIDGTFCSGGAEANHTAVLTAIVGKFPDYARKGIRALEKQPVLYVSTQSHHSFVKAVRVCGLGTDCIREIPILPNLKMDIDTLKTQIEKDKKNGFAPFFVVATGGSTNSGTIDPIPEIARIARQENLWFHVDAAWGGGAIFVPEIKSSLAGIALADSITFDAHKWLSVPMGAGIYLTRHTDILGKTFRTTTDYMPKDGAGLNFTDPFGHSIQWSRRFIGLKVLMSLLVAGWEGYAQVIRHQTEMGNFLREELNKNHWTIVNDTLLPTICFIDGQQPGKNSPEYIDALAKHIVSSGKAWISSTRLYNNQAVLRATITNYQTNESDVKALVACLEEARNDMNDNKKR